MEKGSSIDNMVPSMSVLLSGTISRPGPLQPLLRKQMAQVLDIFFPFYCGHTQCQHRNVKFTFVFLV